MFGLQRNDLLPFFHNLLKTRRMDDHAAVLAKRTIQTTAESLRKFGGRVSSPLLTLARDGAGV